MEAQKVQTAVGKGPKEEKLLALQEAHGAGGWRIEQASR